MTDDKDYRRAEKMAEKQARFDNRRTGRVATPDGPGKVLGMEMRKNTNGGPGTRQFRVQLDDGRVRHYAPAQIEETK